MPTGMYSPLCDPRYALERAWCVALCRDANEVTVGFDEGLVAIKVRFLLHIQFTSSPSLAWTR